ncbi:hypothetical protein BH09PSE1_BH09PSE1_27800 [soil metagenome]
MFIRLLSTALAAVFALSLTSAPADAQNSITRRDNGFVPMGQTSNQQTQDRNTMREADRLQNQNTRSGTTPRDPRARRGAAATPTPEQNRAGAEALLTATSTTCQMGEIVLRGQIGQGENVYEVTCATGPGYVLIGTTPPMAADCVLLAGQAEIALARDPAADVGTQCTIESNKNVTGFITAYAVEAGVKCAVDQAASVGKSSDGNVIYEVGCPGADGYWIEKLASGSWKTTECQVIMSSNGKCRFTTTEEQAATVKAWLAGTEGAGCDVSQARYMGGNANGSFYEAKCAVGDGFVVRLDAAKAVQQIYPCAVAYRIGGGCTLSPRPEGVADPAATPAPAAAPAT